MTNRALIVSINYTGTSSALGGCIKDGEAIKKLLVDEPAFNFDESNVIWLRDEQPDKTRLPTRSNMLAALNSAVNATRSGDNLVIAVSSHGSYQKDAKKDEADGRDECLVPLDYQTAGMITDDELRAILDKLPSGSTTFVLCDTCHSGTMFDLPYTFDASKVRLGNGKDAFREYLETDTTYPETSGTIVTLSGCRDAQFSSDTPEGGALTRSFLHAMSQFNNFPTARDLLCTVRDKLKADGFTQFPVLQCGRRIAGNKIVKMGGI
jgi:hypothetical protein